MKIMLLSGGFDPLHVGHLRMIQEAACRADWVVVGLNSDAWLVRKKGYAFMKWEDRREILLGLKDVEEVVGFNDADGTANDFIDKIHGRVMSLPGAHSIMFGNGGDRVSGNVPEKALCEKLGVGLVWELGGGKERSSSDMVKKAMANGVSEFARRLAP